MLLQKTLVFCSAHDYVKPSSDWMTVPLAMAALAKSGGRSRGRLRLALANAPLELLRRLFLPLLAPMKLPGGVATGPAGVSPMAW